MNKKPVELTDEFWTMHHLRALLPLGDRALYDLVAEPTFPAPLALTAAGGKFVYRRDEVRAWLDSRPRAPRPERPHRPTHRRRPTALASEVPLRPRAPRRGHRREEAA